MYIYIYTLITSVVVAGMSQPHRTYSWLPLGTITTMIITAHTECQRTQTAYRNRQHGIPNIFLWFYCVYSPDNSVGFFTTFLSFFMFHFVLVLIRCRLKFFVPFALRLWPLILFIWIYIYFWSAFSLTEWMAGHCRNGCTVPHTNSTSLSLTHTNAHTSTIYGMYWNCKIFTRHASVSFYRFCHCFSLFPNCSVHYEWLVRSVDMLW